MATDRILCRGHNTVLMMGVTADKIAFGGGTVAVNRSINFRKSGVSESVAGGFVKLLLLFFAEIVTIRYDTGSGNTGKRHVSKTE